ncbi:MAG: hypothetical protein IPN69_01565 [Acidobacteria bacterium]|nr:hypothetical protein [Acidobacteriota bacterium]
MIQREDRRSSDKTRSESGSFLTGNGLQKTVGYARNPGNDSAHRTAVISVPDKAGLWLHRMTLTDSLCTHENPVVAYRARRLLAGEPESSRAMSTLGREVGSSKMAKRLLLALNGERFNPYRKWQGPHWTLYSLAEIGFPAGDERLLPLRRRVMDWMFAPAFLKPPMTAFFPDQPRRPRRCASMEGNTIWSQIVLGIVDDERVPVLVDRLVEFQWPDGGWNCDKRPVARTSSVQETLLPLRGLAQWHRATGDARALKAAQRASEFLLDRRLLWRKRDGALIKPEWGGPVDRIHYPIRFYDVLGVLVVMAEIGMVRDPRCKEALDLLESKRLPDGTFPVEWTNVKKADRIVSRGTYADWGTRHKRKGNPFVTVDALYVLREAGRAA